MSTLMIWLLSSFIVIAFFIYLLRKIIDNYENMIERENMSNIKTKDLKPKSVKVLDKVTAWPKELKIQSYMLMKNQKMLLVEMEI